jgi:SAM-dependent methyltransferase
MPPEQAYIGQELAIFAHALNWKEYYTSIIRPYFGRRVVEVGAGLGITTKVMCDGNHLEWICLEPDPDLRSRIDRLILDGELPACCETRAGFVSSLPPEDKFDTFIYIDVLEHIEDDRSELEEAAARLSAGGHLIVLSPAFNFLFSPFDRSIGHYRRYNKRIYRALTPQGCTPEKMVYLDSAGALTSLMNRLVLSQSMPTVRQIVFWDRWIIPVTRWIDPLLLHGFGRSLLGIWKKDGR